MKQLLSKYKTLNRLHKSVVWIVFLFVCYTLAGFFIIPPIIKHVVSGTLTERLARETTIKKVTLNPFTLSLTIEGFSIKEKKNEERFVFFDRFYVNLQSVSIFRLVPVVKEIKLENPFIRIERFADNRYNFSDIIEKDKPDPQPKRPETDSEPFRFALYNIELSGGGAEIIDDTVTKKHTISGLDITIPFVSNLAEDIDVFVEPAFKVNLNGTPIALSGQTKPFHGSLETSLKIDLQKIDLPYYFAYLPVKTNLNPASGKLDLSGGIHFHQAANKTPSVSGEGSVAVSDLSVGDRSGDSVLKLSKFRAELGRSDFLKQDIHLKKIELSGPEVGIVRRKDGTLNLLSLFPAPTQPGATDAPPAGDRSSSVALTCKLDEFSMQRARIHLKDAFKAEEAAPAAPNDMLTIDTLTFKNILLATGKKELVVGRADITGGGLNIRRQPSDEFNFQVLSSGPRNEDAMAAAQPENDQTPQASAADEDAWRLTLSNLAVAEFHINAQDLAAKDSGNMTVDDIQITAENISTAKAQAGSVSLKCRLNREAEIDIASKVNLTPVALKTDIDVKNIHLAWGQPFIAPYVNLALKEGLFNLSGAATVTMGADSTPSVDVTGNFSVDDLLILDSAEKQRLLQLKRFSVEKLNAGFPKPFINIAALSVDGVAGRIIRKADGTLNLLDVMPPAEKPEKTAVEPVHGQENAAENPDNGLQLSVDVINVANSEVNFTDRSITPQYTADLKDIGLSVKGISTRKKSASDLTLAAKLDGQAPFKISGKLSPLTEKMFADLDVLFEDIELSSFSPYAGRYIGQKIKKGKLSVDLDYLIKGPKLDSANKVVIDKIELGEAVDSPDATSLPVGLGIALLKDRSGQISLDIPVSGNLDDPEFSLGSTVLNVITNLLTKAATSPFSLLASMFGGGEDINLVYFEPGTDAVSTAEEAKLDTIVKALFERPSLEIEIRGDADATADTNALVDARFNTILAAEMGRKKQDLQAAADDGELRLTDEEYEKYVRKVYKKLRKEKKKAGNFEEPDEVTLSFMEALIRGDITIANADLKLLASKRALAVKKYLTASEKIAAKRIFIVEADSLSKEDGDDKMRSRVELGIK